MAHTKEFLIEAYRRMQRIRQFEDAAMELHRHGNIPGPLHTSQGQEGEITGACMALNETDYMVGNHRSHGHPIAKGADIRRLMAELFAKGTGVCGGKGGSMHLADFSVGCLGETSIVGNGIPIAAGAALGALMQESGRVSLCFFGDGAASQGTFHETVNMASLWQLPVIFLCENNGYGQLTPVSHAVSIADIADRAAAYSIPGVIVDGQDVLEVYQVVHDAVRRARAGQGPTLIEAKTYRYIDHAANMGRVFGYRPDHEVEEWRQRDPIAIYEQRLIAEFAFSRSAIELVERDVAREVQDAITFAENSPDPDTDVLFRDVFTDVMVTPR